MVEELPADVDEGRRNPNEAIYFREQIEDAAARFRQQVDASRTLVADLTPSTSSRHTPAPAFLAELVNKPGRRAVGWGDRQRHELAARHQ